MIPEFLFQSWAELLRALPRYRGILQEKKGGGENGPQQQGATQACCTAILFRQERLELIWSEPRSRSLLAAFRFYDSFAIEQARQSRMWTVERASGVGSPHTLLPSLGSLLRQLPPRRKPAEANGPRLADPQLSSGVRCVRCVRLCCYSSSSFSLRRDRARLPQRLQQCQQQQAGMDPRDCLVVVCGDMNSSAEDSVHRFLRRGRLEAGTTEAHLPNVEVTRATISHPYALQAGRLISLLEPLVLK